MTRLLLLLALGSALFAHDLLHTVTAKTAVVVTLTYPDGSPYSYEPYTVYAPQSPTVPFQKGVTAQNGTVAFAAETPGTWIVKTASADGHGAVIAYEAKAGAVSETPAAMPLWQRMITGVALIFGLFGLFVLFKPKKGDHA
jgi:nickel transport protein